MTPPLAKTPQNSASPQNPPQESPEILAARERSRQAGYARNRAEAAHKNAVEEKGADSPEAKAAKVELNKAQVEVERLQGELRQLLNLKPVAKSQAKSPEKKSANPSQVAKKPASAPVYGEVVMERKVLRTEFYEKVIQLDAKELHERLEKLLQEIEAPKNKSHILELLHAPKGAVLIQHFQKRASLLQKAQVHELSEPAPKVHAEKK